MGYPANTSNCVKNNSLRVLFSTLFSVLDTLMKQCFSCLIYYLKLTPTLNAILEVSAGLAICIAFFKSCPNGKCLAIIVWRRNMLTLYCVSKRYEKCLNEQNACLQCLIKCLTSFRFYQTRSNAINIVFKRKM